MLVSVVIPCFNAEKSLRRCVYSILKDDHPEKEILIVDNGSTDNTIELANRLKSQYPKTIKVIFAKKRGANVARNAGLREASGEYIQFLDSDDELIDDKLLNAHRIFRSNPGLICVYSDGGVIVNANNRLQSFQAHHENLKAIAMRRFSEFTFGLNTNMPVWNLDYLRKNDLFWDEELACWQESEFYFRILLSVHDPERIRHHPKVNFIRHDNVAGISSKRNSLGYLESQNLAIEKIYSRCRSMGLDSEGVRKQMVDFKWDLLKRSVVGNERDIWRQLSPIVQQKSHSLFRRFVSSMPFSLVLYSHRFLDAIRSG